ncbi:MAG TPA: terminase small subunit [Thermoanaerobaculia bacterium]|nr:terminase small subunit [Thermoanaerobaculia bacterium]
MTKKQLRFVEEFTLDLNGAAAYRRAGYKARSPQVAAAGAERLLRKTEIRQLVSEAEELHLEAVKSQARRVLLELRRIAHVDLRELFDVDGNLLPVHELPDDVAAAVAAVEVVETRRGPDRVRKIKLWDRVRALEILAKHHRLFNDCEPERPSVSVQVVVPQSLSPAAATALLEALRKEGALPGKGPARYEAFCRGEEVRI